MSTKIIDTLIGLAIAAESTKYGEYREVSKEGIRKKQLSKSQYHKRKQRNKAAKNSRKINRK